MALSILETFHLTTAQKKAATLDCGLSVGAGAGCGKTNALTARYLRLIEQGKRPRGVTAITFTERAAREMRNRIRRHVHDWLAGRCPESSRAEWEAVEADIDAARIGTIHSLCAAILRAHPAEAGIDPRFGVLEEGTAAALQAQAVEDTLAWATTQTNLQSLFELFRTNDLSTILLKLLHARLGAEAAFKHRDPFHVWSSAVGNALRQFTEDKQVCSVRLELRDLFESGELLEDAGDKLAAQVELLLELWNQLEARTTSEEYVEAARVLFSIRQQAMDARGGKKESQAKQGVAELKAIYNELVDPWLGGAKKDDLPPDAALEERVAGQIAPLGGLFEHALDEYRKAKDRRSALDFDDLEAGALALLQHLDIRARWQKQIDALLVDEFQDTNEQQRLIIEALAGSDEQPLGRLFVVGDPKQSIYRFRGADVTVFRQVERDIVARGGQYLPLDQTFRAHAALISGMNEILGKVMGYADDPARPYYIPFRELEAYRESPRGGVREPYIEFLCGLGESAEVARPAEAALLARRLRELYDAGEIRWSEVACLFRASTGFPEYEAAFENAGIPFVTVAGRGFYDRPEIRDVLNILRAIADPTDDLAVAGLLRSPAFAVSDRALYQLRWQGGTSPVSFQTALKGDLSALTPDDQRRVREANDALGRLTRLVNRIPVAELLSRILAETHLPAILKSVVAAERLQRNLDKLLGDAQSSALVSVSEFLEYINTLQEAGAREGEAPAEAGGSVRLMSVHRAKGLEFPVVVLADAARARPSANERVLLMDKMGVVPRPGRIDQVPMCFRLAKMEDQLRDAAEDLRLLYVAATRAQEKLIVCAHQTNRKQAWFNQLLEAAGFAPEQLTSQVGAWQFSALDSGEKIGLLAATFAGADSPNEPNNALAVISESSLPPIYEPLIVRVIELEDGKTASEDILKRANRLNARERHRDGSMVGELFHRAVRRWYFPQDPRLDGLLWAAALEMGLIQHAESNELVQQVKQLLTRLRADPQWHEIDSASVRRSEVPYRFREGDRFSTGVIDLLYQAKGKWCIVDFKTDTVSDAFEMQQVIKSDYRPQLQRYQRAVYQLLGQSADATLCFMDWAGTVKWEAVETSDSVQED